MRRTFGNSNWSFHGTSEWANKYVAGIAAGAARTLQTTTFLYRVVTDHSVHPRRTKDVIQCADFS